MIYRCGSISKCQAMLYNGGCKMQCRAASAQTSAVEMANHHGVGNCNLLQKSNISRMMMSF